MLDESDLSAEQIEAIVRSHRDPRSEVWCSDHRSWREKCQPVHRDFSLRLERAREQFKDVG